MANNASSRKRVRQTARRTAINKSRISRIRTTVRKLEQAIAKGDQVAARVAFAEAEPALRKGVSKGVLHINTVSRKISRLAVKVNALGTQPSA